MSPPVLRLAACFAVTLVAGACQSDPQSPRGVAERFVDQHYVNINLEAAKPFCSGLALRKLEDEQRLTRGQVIDESTRKPLVHYRLLEKREDGSDSASYVFEGTIRVEDAGTFTRKWIVTTRRADTQWTVSNFEEFD